MWCAVCVVILVMVQSVVLIRVDHPDLDLPESYILDVWQDCGNNTIEGSATTIHIRTDLNIASKVKCVGGNVFPTQRDSVDYRVKVFFSGSETEQCVYQEIENTRIYSVILTLSVMVDGSELTSEKQVSYYMTCNYDSTEDASVVNNNITEQFHAPKNSEAYVGPTTPMGVTVVLTDVIGDPVRRLRIPLDKTVRLIVYLDNSSGLVLDPEHTSLFPSSCQAVGLQTGNRHDIIRSGCGDGIVFDKKKGFSMSPMMAVSPYFNFFRLENDSSMRIECRFIVCTECIRKNSCSGEEDLDIRIMSIYGHWLEAGHRKRSLFRPRRRFVLLTSELSITLEESGISNSANVN